MKKYNCTSYPKETSMTIEKDVDGQFHMEILDDKFITHDGLPVMLTLSKENAQDLANYLQSKIDTDRIDNVKDAIEDLKNVIEDLDDGFDMIKKRFNKMQEEINNAD